MGFLKIEERALYYINLNLYLNSTLQKSTDPSKNNDFCGYYYLPIQWFSTAIFFFLIFLINSGRCFTSLQIFPDPSHRFSGTALWHTNSSLLKLKLSRPVLSVILKSIFYKHMTENFQICDQTYKYPSIKHTHRLLCLSYWKDLPSIKRNLRMIIWSFL